VGGCCHSDSTLADRTDCSTGHSGITYCHCCSGNTAAHSGSGNTIGIVSV